MRVLSASSGARRTATAVVTATVLVLGLSGLVVAPSATAAPPGWVDRTYGTNGYGVAGVWAPGARPGAVDSSGRAVLVTDPGTASQAVTRLTVDGAVDPTFGSAGSTPLAGPAPAQVFLGSDGIYLLAAPVASATSTTVTRLTPDGLLDATYGTLGVATVTFSPFPADGLRHLGQLADGTLVLAGNQAIAALTVTGQLDSSWNPGGGTPGVLVVTGLNDITGLAADGNEVIATRSDGALDTHLYRWLRSADPDPAFGGTGTVELSLLWSADGISVGPDGDYYLTAHTFGAFFRPRGVVRTLPDGSVDSTYGDGGVVVLPVQEPSNHGASLTFHGSAAYLFNSYGVGSPQVSRLTSAGALDPTFGSGGLAQLTDGDLPAGRTPMSFGGGVQPDGRPIVLLGYTDPTAGTMPLGAVRFNAATIALAGSFVPLVPARLLDTRVGLGATVGAVPGGSTIHVQVGGRGGVPAIGAASVVLNLTAVRPSRPGHVTAFPTGQGRPRASSLNFQTAQTTANLATIELGAGGQLTLTNSSSGSTDLLADVVGYYLDGTPTVPGSFVTMPQTRLLDTRVGKGAPLAPVAARSVVALTVAGAGGVPASGVSAVVLDLTVTNAFGPGYITAYPSGVSRPVASTLNHSAGEIRANLVTVRLGADGVVDLYNAANARIDLIADLAGYFLGGTATQPGTFVAVDPVRVLDTRAGIGAVKRPVHARSDIRFPAVGSAGPPASAASAVLLNVTATGAAHAGSATVMGADIGWPGDPWDYTTQTPTYGAVEYPTYPVSTVNFLRGQNVANLTIATGSAIGLAHNGSSGDLGLVADLAGYFNP